LSCNNLNRYQILTFDSAGISSHPNHISLPYGVAHLIQHLQSLDRPVPRLYVLTTVPLFAKYTSILAPLIAKFDVVLTRVFRSLLNLAGDESALSIGLPVRVDDPAPSRNAPVFVSGIPEYMRALKAMRMHESQLVWFRWLYVSFSRYMWVNHWQEVQVQ
jgi:N-acetylglucosaminylphosphatidylinositol deacetylase